MVGVIEKLGRPLVDGNVDNEGIADVDGIRDSVGY